MLNATQSYKQAQVNTVGRADITLMLYDGLLRFLDLAAEKMEQKQIQDKGNYISRALDIINELDSTLNMEKGGEISKGLHNLYLLTNKNLLMANLKNDLAILKSVRANMQVVRDSFYEAMQTEEAKEMLMKMGPVPVQTSNGNAQMKFGGSIQERADKIKEAQQKAEAIKRVQAKLANAENDEEKSLAKKELEELLGKNIVAAHNKPVAMSMAQKASRAFMQQQGLSQVSMQMKMQNQTMQVNSAHAHSAQGNPAHVNPAAQTAPAAQLGQQSQTEQAAAPAMAQNSAFAQQRTSSQAMHAMASAYASRQQMQSQAQNQTQAVQPPVPQENTASVSSQNEEEQQEKSIPQSRPAAMGQMAGGLMAGGLMSKKMSLYKNM